MLSVWITFHVERIHSWPNAPLDLLHGHLRNPHRHLFYVRVEAAVDDAYRRISFEELKNTSARLFADAIPYESTYSCEEMAVRLGDALYHNDADLALRRIDVSEDGENGATWLNVQEEEDIGGTGYGGND